MDIVDAKTARVFVAAWTRDCASPRRRAFHFKLAHEGQSLAAGMAFAYGRKQEEKKARAAMRVLEQAERAALCQHLGVPLDSCYTTSELWRSETAEEAAR